MKYAQIAQIKEHRLKVVGNEKRAFGKVSNVSNMSWTLAIDVLFSFNFAVVFDFMYFRFLPSKAKWIGNVLTNRQNAAIRSMFFFSFTLRIAYWRTESFCVIRQSGVNRKKAREVLTGNYRRCNIVAHCLMAQGALFRLYISACRDMTQRFIYRHKAMRAKRVKNRKYVPNLNRQCAGSFAASIMVDICCLPFPRCTVLANFSHTSI